MEIKICGIKSIKEVEILNEFNPDYAGYIFYKKSKRYINENTAQKLSEKLNKNIKKVGVFVNEDIDKIIDILSIVNLDVIQLHGDEDNEYIVKLSSKIKKEIIIWMANRVFDDINIEIFDNVDGYLFDSGKIGTYGGTGVSFNWDILKNIKKLIGNKQFILSGGLGCDNVIDAINVLKPDIIDLNSKLETNGFKDKDKIKELYRKLKGEGIV